MWNANFKQLWSTPVSYSMWYANTMSDKKEFYIWYNIIRICVQNAQLTFTPTLIVQFSQRFHKGAIQSLWNSPIFFNTCITLGPHCKRNGCQCICFKSWILQQTERLSQNALAQSIYTWPIHRTNHCHTQCRNNSKRHIHQCCRGSYPRRSSDAKPESRQADTAMSRQIC